MGALTGKGDNWLNSHMFHDFCLVQGFLGIFVREKKLKITKNFTGGRSSTYLH